MIRINPRVPAPSPYIGVALVPYGEFYVFIQITDSSVNYPITVHITEDITPPTTIGSYTLTTVPVLDLSRQSRITDPLAPLHRSYDVSSLSSFEMRWNYISFPVRMLSSSMALTNFKGSIMQIVVTQGPSGGIVDMGSVLVVNSNPNNHFHWKMEPDFVDGWYFKCVHVDKTAHLATPFFFLYGVNKPAGGSGAECFVMCSNNGTSTLESDLTVPNNPTITRFDSHYWTFPVSDFSADRLWGLRLNIGSDFSATDLKCTGRKVLAPSDEIEWDLNFRKIHAHSKTDWDPFGDFEIPIELITAGLGYIDFPGNILLHYLNFVPGVNAYYMSHNMNSYVTGTINWRGTTYTFDNDKGYQDENWGSGGFPHPYVWMQANNFRDNSGKVLHDTAIVALYAPNLPHGSAWLGHSRIGGICLRHEGKIYKFFDMDHSIFGPVPAYILSNIPVVGSVTCIVDFAHHGSVHTVDIQNPSNITSAIGSFLPGRTPPAIPIRWHMTGQIHLNGNPLRIGNQIDIRVECIQSTVDRLKAPMDGVMTDFVTKESLHCKFTVQLTLRGGDTITLISDFGTAEYGD